MAIAMKDLEIRGAGNLLGGEQSGHIADVGFDLYVRLVGEAVAEFRLRGRRRADELGEVRIELPVDAHLPARPTSPASGCGSRCTAASPRCAPTTTSTRSATSWTTATASRRSRSRSLLLVARFRARARQAGVSRGHGRRQATSGSRRSTCPSRASYASNRLLPEQHRQDAGRHRCSCRGPHGEPVTGGRPIDGRGPA